MLNTAGRNDCCNTGYSTDYTLTKCMLLLSKCSLQLACSVLLGKSKLAAVLHFLAEVTEGEYLDSPGWPPEGLVHAFTVLGLQQSIA